MLEHRKTIPAYVSKLQALSKHCNFGDTLDLVLRDCLVCGFNEPQIQKQFLPEPKPTFHKASELSSAFSAAIKADRKDIQKLQWLYN